jgi:hypothetical protein
MVLYEFSTEGEFRRKLELFLLEFNPDGCAQIERRVPGKPIIRDGAIHFFETLHMRHPTRWRRICYRPVARYDNHAQVDYDFEHASDEIRIDYLFSRSGERQAVWADSTFADHYRQPSEPFVPSNIGLGPQGITRHRLIEVIPSHFRGHVAPNNRHQAIHRDIQQQIAWVERAGRYLSIGGRELSCSRSAEHSAVDFPQGAMWSRQKPQMAWGAVCSDQSAVWFAGSYCSDEEYPNYIWRLDVGEGKPLVQAFRSWHDDFDPWERFASYENRDSFMSTMVRAEKPAIRITNLLPWNDKLLTKIELLDATDDTYLGEFTTIHVFANDELVRGYRFIPNTALLTDLNEMTTNLSAKASLNTQLGRVTSPYPSKANLTHLDHRCFSQGLLYSKAQESADKIVVTNVDDESVYWFTPRLGD